MGFTLLLLCHLLSAPCVRYAHRRYKSCRSCARADYVTAKDGVLSRFCQQCGKFHSLDYFDGALRTCREGLAKHSDRRRQRKMKRKQENQASHSVSGTKLGEKGGAPAVGASPSDTIQIPGGHHRYREVVSELGVLPGSNITAPGLSFPGIHVPGLPSSHVASRAHVSGLPGLPVSNSHTNLYSPPIPSMYIPGMANMGPMGLALDPLGRPVAPRPEANVVVPKKLHVSSSDASEAYWAIRKLRDSLGRAIEDRENQNRELGPSLGSGSADGWTGGDQRADERN